VTSSCENMFYQFQQPDVVGVFTPVLLMDSVPQESEAWFPVGVAHSR